MNIGALPEPEEYHLWPGVMALLDHAAMLSGFRTYDPDDIVWLAIDDGIVIGAATSRLIGNQTAELIHVAGTRFREWVPQMENMICLWAKACGARVMQAQGRKGWIRLNKAWGWNVTAQNNGTTYYEKEL